MFDEDEVSRLENAELILIGVPPSELAHMSIQQRQDVMAVHRAKLAAQRGEMPDG